jgi:hypothetical protein
MLVRFSLALLCLLASSAAFSEPYFAVQTGLKCMSCHVNPTGGGMRTEFGNAWGQNSLPAQYVDVGTDRWTGKVTKFLGLGANLRATGSYTDVPHQSQQSQSQFDLDEARLYVELTAIPDRLSIYVDQRIAPGGSDNLEAYGRYWWGNRTWYVQAGQMYLPYGLRLEDDSAFIREVPGINFATPDQGVQIGLETTHWSAQLAVTNGTASGPEDDKGKQFSLRAEYVQSIWRAGASANFNDADAGDRTLANIFAGVRTGHIAWLGEADYIVDKGFVDGERKQWVGLLEANWLIRQGQNLKLTAEFFEPDTHVDEDKRNRYSILYEYTPVQFLQLRLGARLYDGIPQNDLDNRTLAFAQLNAYF